MSNKRFLWLDIIKIFACFNVIINHVAEPMMINHIATNTIDFYLCAIHNALSRVAVPLFLMVTGFLLLEKDYSFKDSLKKIIRIIIPLVIFSLIINYKWGQSYSIKNFFKQPINEAYWYLYILIGLYIMIPILQKIVKVLKQKDYIYLFVICLVIPGIVEYLNIFNIEVSKHFTEVFFSPLIAYPMMGLYLKNLEKSKENKNIAWLLLICSSLIYASTFIMFYLKEGVVISAYKNGANVFVSLMSISSFYLFRYYFEGKKIKAANLITNISLTTFGIYLLHVLYTTKMINSSLILNVLNVSPILAVLLAELLLFIICGTIIYIVRKIPLVNKFL